MSGHPTTHVPSSPQVRPEPAVQHDFVFPSLDVHTIFGGLQHPSLVILSVIQHSPLFSGSVQVSPASQQTCPVVPLHEVLSAGHP